MCGFAGSLVFESNHFRVSDELITAMRETMVHRGPDAAGTWVSSDKRIGLGFRRLSIVDLSDSADQPMHTYDNRYHIVFNGEIYNHQELRQTLEEHGHRRWQTDHSDTEVILHAFEEWGISCLDHLRGMFAIALWDSTKRELWLARDRIGIKPLYFSIHHGRISFASEIKALLADPQQQREVDEEALYHYLSFLCTPAPMTLFKGIRKIPGGCFLKVDERGSVSERRYWDVWDRTVDLQGKSDETIAEELLHELRSSVNLRKVSDVPIGVFLSGGIDSSTNAALFAEHETQAIRSFTIGYQGDYASYKNETTYAKLMADEIGAQYHEKLLNQDDVLDFLPKMVDLQDEPIGDPVCVPVYYLAQLARQQGVIVCQVGEGSDELFWGYEAWKRDLRLQEWDTLPIPNIIKRLGLRSIELLGKEDSFRYEWLKRSVDGTPIFWGAAAGFSETKKRKLLSPDFSQRLAGLSSWEALQPIHQRFRSKAPDRSPLNWMSFLELNLRLPELLLMRVDKMAMGASLEARVPFLDHRFVEFAMSIPPTVKTRDNNLKSILKKAVTGLIPDQLIQRPKQGFSIPLKEWFLDRLGDEARKDVEAFAKDSGLLDPSEALKVFDRGLERQPWYLLNLALWWRKHIA